MVGLLQSALANLDDVCEIPPDLQEELATDSAFAVEQAVQRILVVASLLVKSVECLDISRLEGSS